MLWTTIDNGGYEPVTKNNPGRRGAMVAGNHVRNSGTQCAFNGGIWAKADGILKV
jgi:hypothetical protein